MNVSTILMILLIAEITNAAITVRTSNGLVLGTTLPSGTVEAFLGVPYAEPPVGNLRFAKPVPKSSWQDVYHANRLPPSCIQTKIFEVFTADLTNLSEDCLYLNIWLPQSPCGSKRKPIFIFIHGGSFMLGSGSQKLYDGASLAEHGDVIVVGINYRLGGLGFFTGFIDDAPGNVGLHDQVAAIRWIKENAKNFQGDPDNIVLMGESAGAFSVTAHLLSPLSKNLFTKAILLSGSLLHPIFSENNNKQSNLSEKYANIMGCTSNGETLENNPESIVECMKNLPAERFAETDTKIMENLEGTPRDIFTLIFSPRVGDDFLPENIIDSFREGDFKDAEILIGINRDEGSPLLTGFNPELFGLFGEKDVTNLLNETSTRQFIRDSISSGDESEDDKIIQTYMDRVNEEEEYAYVKALIDAVGDYAINCGSVFQADIQSLRNNPIYFYMFDYVPPSVYPEWMGVPHGVEMQYIFGNFHREYTEMEKAFSQDLMDRLVNFAKIGHPNIPRSVTWPRYTYQDPKYLVIGEQDTVRTQPLHNRCEIWRKRFGSIIDDDLIQSLKSTES